MVQEQKKHTLEITRKRAFVWGLGLFFIMAWMFVLGILVGRGLTPLPIDAREFKKELEQNIAQSAQQKHNGQTPNNGQSVADGRPLGFHEALREPLPKVQYKRQPAQTAKKSTAPTPSPRKKRVTTVAKSTPSPKAQPAAQPKATPPPKSKPADPPSSKNRFTVQVAAFKDLDSADRLVQTLRSKGYKAYHIGADKSGAGRLYRVRVGAFSDRPAAQKMVNRLKTDQMDGLVVSTQ